MEDTRQGPFVLNNNLRGKTPGWELYGSDILIRSFGRSTKKNGRRRTMINITTISHTIRLSLSTSNKLAERAKELNCSESDFIEALIDCYGFLQDKDKETIRVFAQRDF